MSEPAAQPAEPLRPDEERKAIATQWQLMWWKFCDHKVAYISMYVLVLLYLMAIFAEFVSPHDPNQRSAAHRYSPPQRVHLFHNGSLHRPFVYPMVRHIDPETRARSINECYYWEIERLGEYYTSGSLSKSAGSDGSRSEGSSLRFIFRRFLLGYNDDTLST